MLGDRSTRMSVRPGSAGTFASDARRADSRACPHRCDAMARLAAISVRFVAADGVAQGVAVPGFAQHLPALGRTGDVQETA